MQERAGVRERERQRANGREYEGRGARRQFAPTDPYGRWFFLPQAPLEGPPGISAVCATEKQRSEPVLVAETRAYDARGRLERTGFLMDCARNNERARSLTLGLASFGNSRFF